MSGMLRDAAASPEAGGLRADRRIAALDIARGLALLLMATYHFSWDLRTERLVSWPVANGPLWRAYAMAIAASFLFISGVSLRLAHPDRVDLGAFGVRLLRLTAAAAAVSIATYLMFPDAWVFFGILHMMAVGSLIALPLRRLPGPLLLALAALAVALPALWSSPSLDGLPLAVTGLSTSVPTSNDFVPIFPWIAPMLVGLAAAGPIAETARRGPATGRIGRFLALLGRWSLAFYLVHQLLLYGLAAGLAEILPVDRAIERAGFVADCNLGCVENGGPAAYCQRFCGCVAAAVDGTPIWSIRNPDRSFAPLIATAATTCEQPPDFDTGAPDKLPAPAR